MWNLYYRGSKSFFRLARAKEVKPGARNDSCLHFLYDILLRGPRPIGSLISPLFGVFRLMRILCKTSVELDH